MSDNLVYILKRVAIGVGIALILAFLKGGLILNTHAKEISSIFNQIPDGNSQTVNNMTQYVNFNFNSGHWSNWGYGILRFNFSIIKVGGSSLAPLVVPSNVSATNYACDVSSTSTSNSTFTGSTYSASCPMIMGQNGLEFISIVLTDNQQNEQGVYRITIGSLLTFEKIEDVTLDTSSTNSAINNQTQNDNNNTQSIINNQNSNKQDIINNQNSNTDKQIDSQKVCKKIDKANISYDNHFLYDGGEIRENNDFGITDFIPINTSTIKVLSIRSGTASTCFYNVNKSVISCIRNTNLVLDEFLDIPPQASFVRFSINKLENKPTYNLCTNGNQALENTLNDDSIDSSGADSFFGNFNFGDDTLSSVITAPLRFFNRMTDSCTPLKLTWLNTDINIPCGTTIFWEREDVSTFRLFWNILFGGVAIYYLSLKLYKVVHNAIDPQNDNIETVGV